MKELSEEALAQGKKEMDARRKMAKEDEAGLLRQARTEHQEAVVTYTTNWSLYNYILSSIDFKDCKDMGEGMRKMFTCLWIHIRRYHNERKALLDHYNELPDLYKNSTCDEIAKVKSPMKMAEDTLNAVGEAARQRAKARKYGLVAAKPEIIKA